MTTTDKEIKYWRKNIFYNTTGVLLMVFTGLQALSFDLLWLRILILVISGLMVVVYVGCFWVGISEIKYIKRQQLLLDELLKDEKL